MRLRTRLILGILAAAMLPLLLLGLAATQEATRAISRRVVELHVQKANNLATFVDTYMAAQLRGLQLVMQAFWLEHLDDAQRQGFQRLAYRQFENVNIVSLVGPSGEDLAPSQFISPGSDERLPIGHDYITLDRFRAFRDVIPVGEAMRAGTAIGAPYLPPDSDYPVVPIAIQFGSGEPGVMGVELSLKSIVEQMEAQVTGEMEVALLETNGQFVARRGTPLVQSRVFRIFLGGTTRADLDYQTEDGRRVLAAFSIVPSMEWLAVVAEPYDVVTAPGRDIRLRSAYFGLVAAALAVVLGLIFSRQIHLPVLRLRDAALEVGRGALGHEVVPDRILELGELGRAFNEMSSRLKLNRDEIEAQKVEIETFNLELQQRVDERTRELSAAQDRLVASGKLAAVAELGAGLAHELNNPLAGVLGLAQILRRRKTEGADDPLLASLEEQALRCSQILRSLQSLTQDDLNRGEAEIIDLDHIMAEVVALVAGAFRQRTIRLDHEASPIPLLVRANRPKLARALTQLLTSLRALAADGGGVRIAGRRGLDEIHIYFELSPEKQSSTGIDKDDWYASGMSLWVARRILAEQGGRLNEPAENHPETYTLILPEA